MNYTGCCSGCDKCMLVPITCIHEGVTILHRNLSQDKLRQVYFEAQREFIIGTLGDTCFESLCEAVSKSILEDTDPEYAALSELQTELLETHIKNILRVGASFMWLTYYGWEGLTSPETQEERDDLKSNYQSLAYRHQNRMKRFLSDNWDEFQCGDKPSECGEDPDIDVIGGSWLASTAYPRGIDMGDCPDCL